MPATEYTPTVNELGQFMKTRTKTRWNQVAGTFNNDTPVTAEEALGLIAEAVDETALAIGPNLPDGPEDDISFYRRGAKAAVLLLASMNVELTLVPETSDDKRSAYAALERRRASLMKVLIEALAEAAGGDGGGESVASGAHGMPSFGFEDQPNRTMMTERF